MEIPIPRKHVKRLTKEQSNLLPGQHFLLTTPQANSLRAIGRQKGWPMVQRKEGNMIRVWRLS
jgi:hypothetical protein